MKTISQAQQDYIDYLKHRLSHYDIFGDSVMDSVVQRTSLTFESRGCRDLDINDLHDKADALEKQIENVIKQRQASSDNDERDRMEQELGRMQSRLTNIESLIRNEGKEPLLGLYDPESKSITLYVDNIYDTAVSLQYNLERLKENGCMHNTGFFGVESEWIYWRHWEHRGYYVAYRGDLLQYILERLTGYVFVHEMFHAYYDMDCMSIPEIEEAMAEYGALSFLMSIHEFDTFKIAINEVQAKKYSGVWTSAYGFGKYIFDCNSHPYLVYFYRAVKTSVLGRKQLTAEFANGFSSGYPFTSEHKYFDLLLRILSKS